MTDNLGTVNSADKHTRIIAIAIVTYRYQQK